MGLSPGTRLGWRENQAHLAGSPHGLLHRWATGGMGEVYRARDTRLGRDVAIKIRPRHLTELADAKQRFEREAHAVSSLNHAHICTLHDIGIRTAWISY
jgi:eukaryotic-like serine/threonine-protein kinase